MAWKENLSVYDQAALVDLTSVGLVRRAGKQVAAGRVEVVKADAADAQGEFRVGGRTVILKDAPLAEAECDCRATGLCVHILAALLFVQQAADGTGRDGAAGSPSIQAEIEAELLALTPEAIFKWAGKPATRQAIALLSRLPEGERRFVDGDNSLEIVLAEEARCRYLPGGDLDTVICEVPDRRRKGVVTACLIHWLEVHGVRVPWPTDLGGGATGALGLSAEERVLIRAVREQLAAMLGTGLMHLPRHRGDVLADLAASARGGRLPRLAALLRQLGGEMEALRERRTGADAGQVLDRLVHAHILCRVLEESPVEAMDGLRGQFRREYVSRRTGLLWMAGAHQYETRSGARGLSLILWDLERDRPYTVNCGRTGEAAGGFDPTAAWRTALGWKYGRAPRDLNNQLLYLDGARASFDDRLSLSGQTTLVDAIPAADAAEAIAHTGHDRWDELSRVLAANLQTPRPLLPPIFIRPRKVAPLILDEIAQEWVGWALDEKKAWLRLSLPVSEGHNIRAAAINKSLDAVGGGLLGLTLEVRLVQQRPVLQPVSLVAATREGPAALHPDLEFVDLKKQLGLIDTLKGRLGRRKAQPPEDVAVSGNPAARQKLIARLQDMVLGAAEVGLDCPYMDARQTEKPITSLKSAGALHLARLVERLGRGKDADVLIQAHYALQLARRRLHIHDLTHAFDDP